MPARIPKDRNDGQRHAGQNGGVLQSGQKHVRHRRLEADRLAEVANDEVA
jgi:hypothetical protein